MPKAPYHRGGAAPAPPSGCSGPGQSPGRTKSGPKSKILAASGPPPEGLRRSSNPFSAAKRLRKIFKKLQGKINLQEN